MSTETLLNQSQDDSVPEGEGEALLAESIGEEETKGECEEPASGAHTLNEWLEAVGQKTMSGELEEWVVGRLAAKDLKVISELDPRAVATDMSHDRSEVAMAAVGAWASLKKLAPLLRLADSVLDGKLSVSGAPVFLRLADEIGPLRPLRARKLVEAAADVLEGGDPRLVRSGARLSLVLAAKDQSVLTRTSWIRFLFEDKSKNRWSSKKGQRLLSVLPGLLAEVNPAELESMRDCLPPGWLDLFRQLRDRGAPVEDGGVRVVDSPKESTNSNVRRLATHGGVLVVGVLLGIGIGGGPFGGRQGESVLKGPVSVTGVGSEVGAEGVESDLQAGVLAGGGGPPALPVGAQVEKAVVVGGPGLAPWRVSELTKIYGVHDAIERHVEKIREGGLAEVESLLRSESGWLRSGSAEYRSLLRAAMLDPSPDADARRAISRLFVGSCPLSESIDLFERLLSEGEPYLSENLDLLAALYRLSKGSLADELEARIEGLLAVGAK